MDHFTAFIKRHVFLQLLVKQNIQNDTFLSFLSDAELSKREMLLKAVTILKIKAL